MKNRVKHINLKLFALITLTSLLPSVLLFSGCGQSNQQQNMQQQSAQGQKSEEKAPDKLKKLEESIESIIASLDGPSAGKEEKKQEEGQQSHPESKQEQTGQDKQQQPEGDQSEQQNKQEQTGQQDKQEQQSQQGKQTQQKAPQKDPWKEIGTTINNLHYQWNDYAPEAIKKGASRELTDKFSGNLNALTNEINKKDKATTLAAANKTYSGIADFYSIYRTKTSPEIKRMRYYARNAILSATAGDWNQAVSDSGNLKASWTMFKNTLTKDQQELSGKLDLAIYELDKVVTAKDAFLTDLKGRVVISDMAEIEKAAEKADSGS